METARREENELLLLKEENVQDLNNKKEKPIVNDSNNSEREILKLKVNVYIYNFIKLKLTLFEIRMIIGHRNTYYSSLTYSIWILRKFKLIIVLLKHNSIS